MPRGFQLRHSQLVGQEGLEPSRLSAAEPKSAVTAVPPLTDGATGWTRTSNQYAFEAEDPAGLSTVPMVVRGGFGPPVFTAWVTGLQPAAFNRFAYLTLARLRSVREVGFEPTTTALTVRHCTTQLLPNRTRFTRSSSHTSCQRSKT